MSFCMSAVRLNDGERRRSKGAHQMQYLLMIYANEAEYGKMDAATGQKMMEEYGTFTQSIIQGGNFKAGDRLQPVAGLEIAALDDGLGEGPVFFHHFLAGRGVHFAVLGFVRIDHQ